jgi:putative heme-binding domain-containing protein
LDAFLARKGGPDKLAAAWQAKPPQSDVAKVALRHMYSVGRSDSALSNMLSAAAGIATDPKPPTPEEVKRLAAEVAAKGDAARGEAIFRRADLSCMKCHAVSRAGGNVGPELSAVGGISPVDYVVNSIVDPNLAIKEQFVTRIISTVNGETFTGILIDRDDTRVNLRDAAGKAVTIPKADIDEEFEGKSLMPQGLTKFLTHDELIDLARFISELGRPGPYAIRTVPSVQRWRVMKQPLPAELRGESHNVENFRQFVLDAKPAEWTTVYGKTAGYLPLAELRPAGAKGPTTLFLQGELQVVTAGKAEIVVTSPLPTSLWLEAEPFEGQQKVAVDLTAGKHRLTLRVELPLQGLPEIKVEVVRAAEGGAQLEIVGGM